jgi:CheY-like chemotaxis protein
MSEGEGRGAAFRVQLPISESRSPVADEPARTIAPSRETPALQPPQLKGLRVLVVEDDRDTAELFERFLGDAGASVALVHSVDAALDTLPRFAPHVLVSDIGMPDVDGYEFLRRVRNLDPSQGGAIPAVAVTAFARAEDRTRAILAGYQAHLAKPVDAPELIATVRMLSGLTLGGSPTS